MSHTLMPSQSTQNMLPAFLRSQAELVHAAEQVVYGTLQMLDPSSTLPNIEYWAQYTCSQQWMDWMALLCPVAYLPLAQEGLFRHPVRRLHRVSYHTSLCFGAYYVLDHLDPAVHMRLRRHPSERPAAPSSRVRSGTQEPRTSSVQPQWAPVTAHLRFRVTTTTTDPSSPGSPLLSNPLWREDDSKLPQLVQRPLPMPRFPSSPENDGSNLMRFSPLLPSTPKTPPVTSAQTTAPGKSLDKCLSSTTRPGATPEFPTRNSLPALSIFAVSPNTTRPSTPLGQDGAASISKDSSFGRHHGDGMKLVGTSG